MPKQFVLTLTCRDRPGIVALVSGCLSEVHCDILDAQQFNERTNERFYMRVLFDPADNTLEELRTRIAGALAGLGMNWSLRDTATRRKIVIMVSRFDHCLRDLRYRRQTGEIDFDLVAIISNHPRESHDPAVLADAPFYYFPVTSETKSEQDALVRKVIEESGAELVVLARYMQVLTGDMVRFLEGRCINIHHSFLPGFKGAKPYHQAHQRGVKIIGATSHYVTADLDEGPIITQGVETISHRDSPEDLIARGRDLERRVLARAVKAHLDDRVFLNDNRTVVFTD